jgi:hypothetical protein
MSRNVMINNSDCDMYIYQLRHVSNHFLDYLPRRWENRLIVDNFTLHYIWNAPPNTEVRMSGSV